MSARTYIPRLIAIAHTLCSYMIRYQDKIREHLSVDATEKFDLLLLACIAFNNVVAHPFPGD